MLTITAQTVTASGTPVPVGDPIETDPVAVAYLLLYKNFALGARLLDAGGERVRFRTQLDGGDACLEHTVAGSVSEMEYVHGCLALWFQHHNRTLDRARVLRALPPAMRRNVDRALASARLPTEPEAGVRGVMEAMAAGLYALDIASLCDRTEDMDFVFCLGLLYYERLALITHGLLTE